MKSIEDYREAQKDGDKRQRYPKKKINILCPACNKNYISSFPYNEEHNGICFECYRSLNTWLLERCKEYSFTKVRTGLVLMITLQIGDWLKERRNGNA
jgi:hypothetical protein